MMAAPLLIAAALAQAGDPLPACTSGPPIHTVRLPHKMNASAALDTHAGALHSTWMLPAQSQAWQHFASALTIGERPKLLVTGGSMLVGMDCNDGKRRREKCTYASRLAESLSARCAPVEFVSLASGGVTTSGVLPFLPRWLRPHTVGGEPALLLIDHSANDAHLLDGGDPADIAALEGAVESLIRWLFNEHPNVAILLVETFPGAIESYARVAAHYGIPHVRYGAVVRDWDLGWTRGSARCFLSDDCLCVPHPPWTSHQLIADVCFEAVRALLNRPGASDGMPPPIAPPHRFCSPPLVAYEATDAVRTPPLGVRLPADGGWYFSPQEATGKPGWYGKGVGGQGDALLFDVRFGSAPRLCLAYLYGHEKELADIQLSLVGVSGHAVLLRSMIKEPWRGSRPWRQTRVLSLDAREQLGARPNSTAVLAARLLSCRHQPCTFKIMAVFTC